MVRPELKFVVPGGHTYITMPYGALIGLRLEGLQLVSQMRPFKTNSDAKRPSRNYVSLNGVGDLGDQTIAVAGIAGAAVSKMPVSISGYDDADQHNGAAWSTRGFEGWPCTIGTFKNNEQNEDNYSWFVEISIADAMFNSLVEAYRNRVLMTLYVSIYTDLMIDESSRYSSGPHDFFMPYEGEKTDFPPNVIGVVNQVTSSEAPFAFPTLTEAATPEQLEQIRKANVRILKLEQQVQELERRMKEIAAAKARTWLKS